MPSSPVELCDEKVVVLHAKRELLHVDVVDGTVGGAQQQEGAGRVVRRHGGQLLRLPVLGQAVPYPDTTCGMGF